MSIDPARRATRPGPSDESTEIFLRFQVGEVFYAIRAAGVHNVLPIDVRPIPEKIAKNGVLYPTVDPRSLFRIGDLPTEGRSHQTDERRMILLSAGNRLTALIVDRVFDRLRIDIRRFQPIPWHFGGREQLWFEGVACLDPHRCLVLLRPQGLLASSGPSSLGRSEPRHAELKPGDPTGSGPAALQGEPGS